MSLITVSDWHIDMESTCLLLAWGFDGSWWLAKCWRDELLTANYLGLQGIQRFIIKHVQISLQLLFKLWAISLWGPSVLLLFMLWWYRHRNFKELFFFGVLAFTWHIWERGHAIQIPAWTWTNVTAQRYGIWRDKPDQDTENKSALNKSNAKWEHLPGCSIEHVFSWQY